MKAAFVILASVAGSAGTLALFALVGASLANETPPPGTGVLFLSASMVLGALVIGYYTGRADKPAP